jgi:hypothetical protein
METPTLRYIHHTRFIFDTRPSRLKHVPSRRGSSILGLDILYTRPILSKTIVAAITNDQYLYSNP